MTDSKPLITPVKPRYNPRLNLQPINPPLSAGRTFRFVCVQCGQHRQADERTRADLNGEPYRSYYCGDCLA